MANDPMAYIPGATGLLVLASLSALTWVAFTAYRRARLRHVPGPFLASFTDLWAAYKVWQGELYPDIVYSLHQTYGPVVRWGPNRVSFADFSAIPEVYGTKVVFPKAASYNPLTVLAGGQEILTFLTVRDEKRVTALKRQLLGAFSQSAWLKQEDQIDSKVQLLLKRLREQIGQTVQLDEWLRFWSFDTITQLAFSDDRGALSHGADVGGVFGGAKARFNHWRTWALFPNLEHLLYKNPYVQRVQKPTNPLATLAMQRIRERQNEEKNAGGRDLIGRYMAVSQQDPDVVSSKDLLGLTISTIHAGSETTAITSSLIISHLLTHPDALSKVEQELLDAKVDRLPAFQTIEKLPYLDAVLHESMRFSTANGNILDRTVPAPGATICDTWLPGGTDVSVAEKCITADTELYGHGVDSYRPERWLEADEEARKLMERSEMGFSTGRRQCVGQHLARIEVKKVVAALILNFKISLVEPPAYGFQMNVKFVKLNVRLEDRK